MAGILSIKLGGEAGFGIMKSGEALARAFTRAGYHVACLTEYPSLIRGGHNTYQMCASTEELHSTCEGLDLLLALDANTIDMHLPDMNRGGVVLLDSAAVERKPESVLHDGVRALDVPVESIAVNAGGNRLMRNSVGLGALAALAHLDFAPLREALHRQFRGRGPVAEGNIRAAEAGLGFVREKYPDAGVGPLPPGDGKRRMLLTGNEAICVGAVRAGCRFLAAYPMTPSSSILHYMAAHEKETGIVVKHAEDEIAALCMAVGASWTGARAFTATSGGGFCLMTEALGMAAMTETPIVIIECQRPGPSTGMPTWTEQADLQFVINASQGEFTRVVIAPGDHEEAFRCAFHAFNLADRYQVPVIILSDKYLSESHRSFARFGHEGMKIERGQFPSQSDYADTALHRHGWYLRYRDTADGVSPRPLPGEPGGMYVANTDEHEVDGDISEEASDRLIQTEKRFRKVASIGKELPPPKLYGDPDAEVLLVGWGSTKGPVLEALKLLAARGRKAAFLHYVYLWPFPERSTMEALGRARSVVAVENNRTGQLARLIRETTSISIDKKVLRYDGRPFQPVSLAKSVAEAMGW